MEPPLLSKTTKCCSCSCRGEQTVQGFSPKYLSFSSTPTCGCFFRAAKRLENTRLLMHSASIRNSTHALHVPGTGNAPEEWRWTCVYSSSGSREQIHPDTVQLGPSLRSIVGWSWSNALINRWIVLQDECVSVLMLACFNKIHKNEL